MEPGKFGGLCNALVVRHSSVYDSACLQKSGVSGRTTQIMQVNVNMTQRTPLSVVHSTSRESLRAKEEGPSSIVI